MTAMTRALMELENMTATIALAKVNEESPTGY